MIKYNFIIISLKNKQLNYYHLKKFWRQFIEFGIILIDSEYLQSLSQEMTTVLLSLSHSTVIQLSHSEVPDVQMQGSCWGTVSLHLTQLTWVWLRLGIQLALKQRRMRHGERN